MEEENEDCIVGWSGPEPRVRGSTKRNCAACGNAAWFAPTSLPMLAAGAKPYCTRCGVEIAASAEIVGYVPGAVEEERRQRAERN